MHQDSEERPHAHPELVPPDQPNEPAPPPGEADEGLDLLTIGLFVFFVALIATVGALLLLPAIL
jgi:hypothetical protein